MQSSGSRARTGVPCVGKQSQPLDHKRSPLVLLNWARSYWSVDTTVWSVSQFSRSVVSDSVTPWIAARQASLSITNSRSLLKPMSIESVMPSNHLFLCCPLLFLPPICPSVRVFSNESTLRIRWPKRVSSSASVLPVNTQDWSPLGCTGWISLQSKGLSRVFSSTTVQKHQKQPQIHPSPCLSLYWGCASYPFLQDRFFPTPGPTSN